MCALNDSPMFNSGLVSVSISSTPSSTGTLDAIFVFSSFPAAVTSAPEAGTTVADRFLPLLVKPSLFLFLAAAAAAVVTAAGTCVLLPVGPPAVVTLALPSAAPILRAAWLSFELFNILTEANTLKYTNCFKIQLSTRNRSRAARAKLARGVSLLYDPYLSMTALYAWLKI